MDKIDLTKYLKNGVLKIPKSLNLVSFEDTNLNEIYKPIIKVDLSECNLLTTISSGCFKDQYTLTEVVLPNSITTIEDRAFENCKNLRDVNLEYLDNLTYIKESAFENCNIDSLTLPRNVTLVGKNAFALNFNLTELNLSHVRGKLELNQDAFYLANIKFFFNKCDYNLRLDKSAFSGAFKEADYYIATKVVRYFDYIDLTYFNNEVNDILIKNKVSKRIVNSSQSLILNCSSSFIDIKNLIKKLGRTSIKNLKNIQLENLDLNNIDKNREIFTFLAKLKRFSNFKVILLKENTDWEEKIDSKINYLYSKEEVEILDKINEFAISKKLGELYYKEGLGKFYRSNNVDESIWSHSKVKQANSKIDEIVDKIKESNLTPYEAMIYIHSLIGKYEYKMENDKQSSISRNIVNPLTKENPEIVCVGYASLVKAIIDKLDLKGLECKLDPCLVLNLDDPQESEYHVKNFIIIDDKKYKINGVYNEDVTWDSIKDEYGVTYANFLTPLDNYLNMYSQLLVNNGELAKEYENKVFIKKDIPGKDRYSITKILDKASSNLEKENLIDMIVRDNNLKGKKQIVNYLKNKLNTISSDIESINNDTYNKINDLRVKLNSIANDVLNRLIKEHKEYKDINKYFSLFTYYSELENCLDQEDDQKVKLYQEFKKKFLNIANKNEKYVEISKKIEEQKALRIDKLKLDELLVEFYNSLEYYVDFDFYKDDPNLTSKVKDCIKKLEEYDNESILDLKKAKESFKNIKEYFYKYNSKVIDVKTFIEGYLNTFDKLNIKVDKKSLLSTLIVSREASKIIFKNNTKQTFFDPYLIEYIKNEYPDLLNKDTSKNR